MKPVAVIGAGITGLTAAFYLQRKGIPVTVYEATDRVGGVIQSLRQDGYLAEFGPNTDPGNLAATWATGAGCRPGETPHGPRSEGFGALRGSLPAAGRDARFAAGFLHHGTLQRPGEMGGLEGTVRAGAARTARRKAWRSLSIRRLGQEFLDHAIDALVAGVYAGDPYKLSVPQAFPKLGQLEAKYGSLIKGQIFGAPGTQEARRGGQGSRAEVFVR